MRSRSATKHKSLRKKLPRSRMVYPDQFLRKVKYAAWKVYGPLHPVMRDTCLALGVVKRSGRQDFLLGIVAPHETIESVIRHLINHGYANHAVAWVDDDEVVSLRYVENFVYQYHLRIFEDGEIRGHYEYTPECYPILHLRGGSQEHRRDEFLRILGDKITPSQAS